MTTPVPLPRNLPPQLCPPHLKGRCAKCQAECHRYGEGGSPLCKEHQAEVAAVQKPKHPVS
ncbi:hypothetical protein ACWGIN_27790 [Streptomyces sp. NPDC054861]